MSRLACLLALAGAASAQLTLDGIKCGQLTCKIEEYCSTETNRCAPCDTVCNKTDHNYDSGLCIKECQSEYCIFKPVITKVVQVDPQESTEDSTGVDVGVTKNVFIFQIID